MEERKERKINSSTYIKREEKRMGYRLGICHLNYFLAGLLSAGRCSYILLTGLCKQRPWFLRTFASSLNNNMEWSVMYRSQFGSC